MEYASTLGRLGCAARASGAKALLLAILACCATLPARAQTAIRLADNEGGATCRVVSLTAGTPWQHERGDWSDAEGKPQGSAPFGEVKVGTPPPRTIELDALGLVREAIAQRRRSVDVLLQLMAGSVLAFHSRESPERDLRPVLVVTLRSGPPLFVPADADTMLDCSALASLGATPWLKLQGTSNAALSFTLPATLRESDIASAALRLAPKVLYGNTSTVGAFRLVLPDAAVGAPLPGLAARYRNDIGLGDDPAVLFVEDFESPFWRLHWGQRVIPSIRRAYASGNPTWLMMGARWFRGHYERVDVDPPLGFEPLAGKALRVSIRKGEQLGIDLRYYFLDHAGFEPDAIHLRYYLRLADDWNPVDAGKLPGLAGTYGRAGWGERPTDGTNGWSMRGFFRRPAVKGDQFEGKTPVGSFVSLADADSRVGVPVSWSIAGLGLLSRNRWYCIEQYVRLNDPGVANGEMKAWVDGHLAMKQTGLHFRDTDALKIETAWFDVYHGGATPAPSDLHLYIASVVIARSYIGPMGR